MTTSELPPIDSIRSFYDDFSRQFLVDYVHGNPRIERAIAHVVSWIQPRTDAILDIGCGIGWSTAEIAKHVPTAVVTGVDLSGTSIAIARGLFEAPRVSFRVGDVTDPAWRPAGTFDVAVMIDVYEHIPERNRRLFNRALGAHLKDDARILLSFPSASHQRFLAEHDPAGLQPIDETITEATLEELARDVGGRIERFESVSIWNDSDYVHAVVQKGSALDGAPRAKAMELESVRERTERVRDRLAVRISPDGYLIPQRPGPAVLVVCPVRNAYSETFIKAQIEGLPTRVEVLFGHPPDAEDDQGRSMRPKWARRARFVLFKVFGARTAARWDAIVVHRFLKSRGIRAVLAEYGPTGAKLLDVCRRSSVPLITYFYGFDASDREVIKTYRADYERMLNGDGEVITVSRDLADRLSSLNPKSGTIHWIPCGVDVERFSGSDPAASPPVFLAIGRFVEKKAPHLTLLAFNRVLAIVPEARLVMVGDGPLLGACQQMVKALGMGGSVKFTGPQSHRQLAHLLNGARAFVQHSMTASSGDSEGTPVAILEAGASGVPVVATRHGGIPEVVREGVTGYLVAEGDVSAMAERMIELAADPVLAGRLGGQARAHVSATFGLSESLDQLWHVISVAISADSQRTN